MDKEDFGQEIVRDVLKGLPFDSNKFDEVYTHHFLEHIATGEDLFFVISEVYRVLKPRGKLIAVVPHKDSMGAFYPNHKSYWSESFVEVLVGDRYQGASKWNFAIEFMHCVGDDLHFILRKELDKW